MSNFECESLTITGESRGIIEIHERITMESQGVSYGFLCLRLSTTPVTYFAECQ